RSHLPLDDTLVVHGGVEEALGILTRRAPRRERLLGRDTGGRLGCELCFPRPADPLRPARGLAELSGKRKIG
ncbi:hypothetical protein OC834_007847, partial [Tilletia horrida]